jgi:IS1 family transposase
MSNILPLDKKLLVISTLAEGNSIRAIERMTGVHRDTIMRLGVRVGEACAKIHDEKMHNLTCTQVECDEIWGFIGKKARNTRLRDRARGFGDVWTFIALDAQNKLVPAYLVGKRDAYHAKAFMTDLAARVTNRLQISTDALAAYPDAVERAFGAEIDYGQVVKTYAVVNLNKDAASRYSPAEVVKIERIRISGSPLKELASTSRVEKQNHTLPPAHPADKRIQQEAGKL